MKIEQYYALAKIFKDNGYNLYLVGGATRDMLLNREVRQDLFNKERPILTKTRDDMPTNLIQFDSDKKYYTRWNTPEAFK